MTIGHRVYNAAAFRKARKSGACVIFLLRRYIGMAKCDVCGKGVSFGIQVSHSHRRSNKMWKANVRTVKALVNGTPKTLHVCSRCLRSGKIVRSI